MKTLSQFNEQLLMELFDNPYEYEVSGGNMSRTAYAFTTDDGREFEIEFSYVLDFMSIIRFGLQNIMNYSYDYMSGIHKQIPREYRNLTQYEVSFRDVEHGRFVTDKGDAARIFSTVGEATKDFLRNKGGSSIGILSFSSDKSEQSRSKLYRVLQKRMAKDLNMVAIDKQYLQRFARDEGTYSWLFTQYFKKEFAADQEDMFFLGSQKFDEFMNERIEMITEEELS